MPLGELISWVKTVPQKVSSDMRLMAESITGEFLSVSERLMDLGLDYLTPDRAANTLSTGELQRIQLARAVRNKTTGVLYVLDEPSIGLHPSNVDGLLAVIRDLVGRGNSVVVVDHDTRVINAADYVIEMGVGAGNAGGNVIACGSVAEIESCDKSVIGGYMSGEKNVNVRIRADKSETFDNGTIELSTLPLHTVHALKAKINGERLPAHIKSIKADGINRVNLIDATPIGINVRSTVATYSGILDDLRKLFAATPKAKELGLKVNDFSYNTGSLRCPTCDGTGQISMDIQFLPDVDIVCPDCSGRRYSEKANDVKIELRGEEYSIADLMQTRLRDCLKSIKKLKKNSKLY